MTWLIYAVYAVAVVGAMATWAATATAGVVASVSHNPQLFLDDHLIARMDGLKRKLHRPIRHPANPLIVQDLPWERRMIEMYGTVLYDEKLGKFRCWYLASESDHGIPDTPEAPGTAEYYQCYAESRDGIRWVKPQVGLRRYGPYEKHNIVIPKAHGFCVLPTPHAEDPNQRFRGVGGATLGFSPDGIRWDIDTPACDLWRKAVGKNDTATSVVRWGGEYLAYVRFQEPQRHVIDTSHRHSHRHPRGIAWRGVQRGVGLCVSRDFIHWTAKKSVFKSDARDGHPWTQPYGLCVTPYGDVLIGLVPMLRLEPREGNNRHGPMDVELLVSRDGRKWSRVADRAVFMAEQRIRPGDARRWDRRVYPSTTMLIKDDTVHLYYTGVTSMHGEGGPFRGGFGLATLPADRFVGVLAAGAAAPGVLQTKPMDVNASQLTVNAQLNGAGDFAVEVLDERGAVLAGYGRRQSRLVRADALRYRVMWDTPDEESRSWADTPHHGPRALRFILSGTAELYAFRFLP